MCTFGVRFRTSTQCHEYPLFFSFFQVRRSFRQSRLYLLLMPEMGDFHACAIEQRKPKTDECCIRRWIDRSGSCFRKGSHRELRSEFGLVTCSSILCHYTNTQVPRQVLRPSNFLVYIYFLRSKNIYSDTIKESIYGFW